MANTLVINFGSKTIKFEVFDENLVSKMAGTIDDENGVFVLRIKTEIETSEYGHPINLDAGENKYARIKQECSAFQIDRIAFRIVHGGEKFIAPTLLSDEDIVELEKYNELAPLHNPPAIKAIKEFKLIMGAIPFYGVFDTAFHQSMQKEQFLYGLPYEYYEKYKIRRYGFHGISHKFVSQKFAELEPTAKRILSCHLGSGCSITAIVDGKSFDTSMGFTPLEGLIMTTRPGDIDDGAIDYLRRISGMTNEEILTMENTKSGLLGISGISFDMRVLLEEEARGNIQAKLAIDMFVYRIKKYIGAYAAAMGDVDGLIFTAGIGAGSDVIRKRIITGLEIFNLSIDDSINTGRMNVETPLKISTADSKPIWVIPTDEEYQIAKEIAAL